MLGGNPDFGRADCRVHDLVAHKIQKQGVSGQNRRVATAGVRITTGPLSAASRRHSGPVLIFRYAAIARSGFMLLL